MASAALSTRFVQTWLSSEPIHLDLRQVVRELLHHRDPVLIEPVAQDDQRLLEADAHVDPLARRLVQVRVALHGRHDLADPLDRHAELVEQLIHGCLRRQPPGDLRRLVAQLLRSPAGVHERRGGLGSIGQAGDLVDQVGPLERGAGGARHRAEAAAAATRVGAGHRGRPSHHEGRARIVQRQRPDC